MGLLRSIGKNRNISLIEMNNKINIDNLIDNVNKSQSSNGLTSIFKLGHYDKVTGRKIKSNNQVSDALTYDELVEYQDSQSSLHIKSFAECNDEYDSSYDDEYVCEVCPHRCTAYNHMLCDSCNECEECSEYMDNECSGCSYGIHRDDSYYWERHPNILPKDEVDDTIFNRLESGESFDIKFEDFSIK